MLVYELFGQESEKDILTDLANGRDFDLSEFYNCNELDHLIVGMAYKFSVVVRSKEKDLCEVMVMNLDWDTGVIGLIIPNDKKPIQTPTCPELWLHSCLGKGHWTQAKAEFFGPTEHGESTHVHWYCSRAQAREQYLTLPKETREKISNMKTISFES